MVERRCQSEFWDKDWSTPLLLIAGLVLGFQNSHYMQSLWRRGEIAIWVTKPDKWSVYRSGVWRDLQCRSKWKHLSNCSWQAISLHWEYYVERFMGNLWFPIKIWSPWQLWRVSTNIFDDRYNPRRFSVRQLKERRNQNHNVLLHANLHIKLWRTLTFDFKGIELVELWIGLRCFLRGKME